MKTGGANSPGVERVPKVTAATRPTVILAGRPAAERAPDTGAGGSKAFLLVTSGVTSKAANGGHFKTGQRNVAWD
jgi:hypothetical protein